MFQSKRIRSKIPNSPQFTHCLVLAGREAQQRSISSIEPLLLLHALLRQSNNGLDALLPIGQSARELLIEVSNEIERSLAPTSYSPSNACELTPASRVVFNMAKAEAASLAANSVMLDHLLLALFNDDSCASLLHSTGLFEADVRSKIQLGQ